MEHQSHKSSIISQSLVGLIREDFLFSMSQWLLYIDQYQYQVVICNANDICINGE